MAELDPGLDVVALTAAICDIPSVSGDEAALADAVENLLRTAAHLDVWRRGNVVVARTDLGRAERVVLAGHLDTVPLAQGPHGVNLPTRLIDGVLWGRGTVDMLGGVAVILRLALDITEPSRDVTYVLYDNEEVASLLNGLGHLAGVRPDLLAADFAVLLEPTGGAIEGGCKGTLRVEVTVPGIAAHSGRPWMGDNAIHRAGAVLDVLRAHDARTVDVDGLTYHEGLSAVGIRGGAGNNVIPDECVVAINYRFAPDLSGEQAVALAERWFAPFEVRVADIATGARPGLDRPIAQDFVRVIAGERHDDPRSGDVGATGVQVRAKEGWTDVARFSQLGVPAVNFGPGDPLLAHKDDERCPVEQYVTTLQALARWLS